MKKNVILIGFMGAGKTSVGKTFSGKTGKQLLDTDQLIEQNAGMSISDIFATQGEEAFRQAETAVLEQMLAGTDGAVISAGGGLPLRKQNREMLKQLGTVVFLRVKRETVLERLKGDRTRPLLQGDHAGEKVDELLAYRNPIYEEAAHVTVDVDGKSLDAIVDEIQEYL